MTNQLERMFIVWATISIVIVMLCFGISMLYMPRELSGGVYYKLLMYQAENTNKFNLVEKKVHALEERINVLSYVLEQKARMP
jgi:hypothetical protein